jgi:hypothetical protein
VSSGLDLLVIDLPEVTALVVKGRVFSWRRYAARREFVLVETLMMWLCSGCREPVMRAYPHQGTAHVTNSLLVNTTNELGSPEIQEGLYHL